MDSEHAINLAIESASSGATVTLPPGPIDFTAEDGLRLTGRNAVFPLPHPDGTVLNRTDGGAVVSIRNSTLCEVSNLELNPGPGGIGVDLQWDGGIAYNTNQNVISRLRIRGGRFAVRIGDGSANSVSENTVLGGQFSNQSEAAVLIDSGNGQNTVVDRLYTIGSPWAVRCPNGSFHIRDMRSLVHSEGVVWMANLQTDSSMNGCYTEKSPRFLDTGGPSATSFAFTVRSCFMNVSNADGTPAEAVRYRLGGPLLVEGCGVGTNTAPAYMTVGGLGVTPAAAKYCRFWDADKVKPLRGQWSVENCTLSKSGSAAPPKSWSAPVMFGLGPRRPF